MRQIVGKIVPSKSPLSLLVQFSQRSTFGRNEFYIVLLVKSSDEECDTGERFVQPGNKKAGPKDSHYAGHYFKLLKINIEKYLEQLKVWAELPAAVWGSKHMSTPPPPPAPLFREEFLDLKE